MGRKSKKNRNKKGGATAAAMKPAGTPAKPEQRKAERTPPSEKLQKVARISSMVLGAVFVLAGTLKVGDPWSFLGSLPAYGLPSAIRLPVTVLMPTIEVVLGIMLIAGWRLRQASMATAGFLTLFGGVIAYGWVMGTLQDCGCFGSWLQRTPPQALAEDAGMLALAVLGIMWAPVGKTDLSRFRLGVLATVAVGSIAMIGSTLAADTSTLEERILAAEVAVDEGIPSLKDLDLRNRDVFLYLFQPDCPHCIENGPAIARISQDPELPDVIGITHSVARGDVDFYLRTAGADFPAYEFLWPSFVQITGDGAVPQLVFLRHGRIAQVWKGNLPSTRELKRAIAARSSSSPQ
ncbi:MAG: hypothetical protein IH849_09905 [Acidobacteria bacterium]|nr:hypothetical protein [Acidobacteriota bacterium]